ncbi:hypothetical protein [Nocardioides sp. AE5]|uniref:hypothetical protein n=1 Tax=Nocardioides sp. AE5 TaxID=2962573 RepID=UPI002882CA99|nr:hypothetical protein [Nocardioides sp. AE5]MDT0203175.1 hypothetical protein [Nocardioides sp. AE5]
MMLAHPEVGNFDYSSLDHLLLAAAPAAPEKVRAAMDSESVVQDAECGHAYASMRVGAAAPITSVPGSRVG